MLLSSELQQYCWGFTPHDGHMSINRTIEEHMWIEKTATCPPLSHFLDSVWTGHPQVFLEFILDPTRFPEVARLCDIFGLGVFSQIMYLTRTYAFYVDRYNRNLRLKNHYCSNI